MTKLFKSLGTIKPCEQMMDGQECDIIGYQAKDKTVIFIKRYSAYNTWLFAGLTLDNISTRIDDVSCVEQVYKRLCGIEAWNKLSGKI